MMGVERDLAQKPHQGSA